MKLLPIKLFFCMVDQNLTALLCNNNSNSFDKIPNTTKHQTMTEPPQSCTDNCTHFITALLIFSVHIDYRNQNISHSESLLHTICCQFSVQVLCNLTYLSLFSPFVFLNNRFLTAIFPLRPSDSCSHSLSPLNPSVSSWIHEF